MTNDTQRTARFNELAETYSSDLYRYAMWRCGNEALAKDLVQETFLRAWKALDSLQDAGAAKSWLITILRREYARTCGASLSRPHHKSDHPGSGEDAADNLGRLP